MIRPPPRSPPFPYTTLFRSGDFVGLRLGPQIDRAEPLALLAVALEPGLDLDEIGQRRAGFQSGDRRRLLRRAIERLGDPRSEEHTSELQSHLNLLFPLLLSK